MFYGIQGNTARRESFAARYASCHNVSRAVSRHVYAAFVRSSDVNRSAEEREEFARRTRGVRTARIRSNLRIVIRLAVSIIKLSRDAYRILWHRVFLLGLFQTTFLRQLSSSCFSKL